MEFVRLVILAILSAFLCVAAQAQGHYELKNSDLLQNCSFIHKDEFSLSSFQELVKSQIEARIDGDNVCQAAFRSLNSNLDSMLKIVNDNVSQQEARKLYGQMYGDYIVSLQTELSLLDLSDPQQASRAQTLQAQVDTLKQSVLDNSYQIQLYNSTSQNSLQQSQQVLFSQISGVVQSLSTMPTNCVGKIGGWKQVLPVILNATSYVGMATGQLYMPAAAAGVEAGVEIAMILANSGVKKALTNLVAQKNNQIIACTYQAITSQACELKRAVQAVSDTARVEEIINNRYSSGSEGQYEKYQRALQLMPQVKLIMNKVGEMGSAVTLDLELIFNYFVAVRIRPNEIVIPPANSPDEVIARWLNDMGNRGIEILSTGAGNIPLTLKEKYNNTVTKIENYKLVITTVIATIREKRSFKDLRDELVLTTRNLSKQFAFLEEYLSSFPVDKEELPSQYKPLFTGTLRMLQKIRAFIDVEQLETESYEDFIARVDKLGEEMFAEFSYGSVAQVTRQTVLMIPQISFERFERPFRAIENFYLNRDILDRDVPGHASYADYMIKRAVQVRVLNLYKNLSASALAFRLEAFETTKQSFERGFRKEIGRMIDDSLDNDSPILGGVLKGQTSSHMCALFSDYLSRKEGRLFRRCQQAHSKLPLYQVMTNYRRPIELEIDYNDPCFYNKYRKEEHVQSLLFDRLLDYGFSKEKRR
ncbi:MAG: hypothetical protein K2P81_01695 [Bacteriovoracaceae bacterium]|nr:hypothetical protein [Bacteriovoracaceae bacterium]